LDSFDLATPEFRIGRGVLQEQSARFTLRPTENCPVKVVGRGGRDEEQSDVELNSQCLGIRGFGVMRESGHGSDVNIP
jgi:hypothetical protein